MQEEIKVSVIIPVYNVEQYIADTLNCFLNQTMDQLEIICVDDGSTDNTKQIIVEFQNKDSRIKLITQENRGAGAARNNGLTYAKGKYVYFFDGDDYCDRSLLQKTVGLGEKLDVDIVVMDFFRVNVQTGEKKLCHGLNRNLCPKMKKTFNYTDIPNRILTLAIPTPWNKVFRREFVQKNKLQFLEISSSNDVTFAAMCMAKAERITYLNDALVYYRMNQKNTITSSKQKKLGNVIKAVDSVLEQTKRLGYYSEIKVAVQYFAIDNFIFALENYAGNIENMYYKAYYKRIYKIFRSSLFEDVNKEKFDNDRRYNRFREIQATAYCRLYLKEVKRKLKGKLKPLAYQCSLVSVKRYENRSRDIIRKIDELNRMSIKQEKDIRILKDIINQLVVTENNRSKIENKLWLESITNSEEEINSDAPRVIVSLTSFPARIFQVADVVENMLIQTMRPKKVVLWLAKENFKHGVNDLPIRLLDLQKYGLEIKWCEQDIRSYKKLIPALEEYPDDLIVTVDDDLIYPLDMIEKLYDAYRKYPNAIIAMRTHRIVFDENNKIRPYREWKMEDDSYILEPRMDLFATTGAGTLFPPHLLHEDATNINEILELCPTADDVWFKFMSLLNHVPVVLAAPIERLQYIDGTQEEGTLWEVNMWNNDLQIADMLKKYELSGDYFEN